MAFHQPTRQWAQRATHLPAEERHEVAPQSHTSPQQQHDESQSWVLFSKATDTSTTSHLSTAQSLETPGGSRLSDLASLHTAAGSARQPFTRPTASLPANEDDVAGDDAELDSLDSHLPGFRSAPRVSSFLHTDSHQALPVLPSHDGLGSFRLDYPALGQDAQNQIYQFERFNPRRVRRRTDDPDYLQQVVQHEHVQDADKMQRIEDWRLEQSRLLLDEVQRETRRRRKSQASLHRAQGSTLDATSLSRAKDASSDNMTWHDEDALEQPGAQEGLIAKFTRTVVKDLFGLDDRMFSVLMGESIPTEDDLSATPRASQLYQPALPEASTWQTHVLERVSLELGLLVNQLSHHPGAFSTYTRMQQMPIPYAGLPVIPETGSAPLGGEEVSTQQQSRTSSADFRPTAQHLTSQPINIPERHTEPATEGTAAAAAADVSMGNTFTKAEWEQDLDIKLVFRYLRTRFLSKTSTPSTSSGPHMATANAQDAAAKVARVRQHHPLIARPRPLERRSFRVTTPGSPVALRHHSSCASQSTRRSGKRSSMSSRHYWDLGVSLGTGSMIASPGPMGSWGEV